MEGAFLLNLYNAIEGIGAFVFCTVTCFMIFVFCFYLSIMRVLGASNLVEHCLGRLTQLWPTRQGHSEIFVFVLCKEVRPNVRTLLYVSNLANTAQHFCMFPTWRGRVGNCRTLQKLYLGSYYMSHGHFRNRPSISQ